MPPTHDPSDPAAILAALLESVPVYVYLKDAERRFVCVSRSFERLTQRTARELIGFRGEDVFPPVFMEQTTADERRVIEHAEPMIDKLEAIEVPAVPARWLVSTKLPWRDPSGGVRGLIGISREMTERERAHDALAQSERRYRGVVEAQSDFIVRWLPDGRRTFVNRAYCDYFGVDREAALGSSVWPVVPAKDQAVVERHVAGLTPNRPTLSGEHRVLRPHGRNAWYQWSLLGFFDAAGKLVELQAVGRDVSERKEAEIRQALLTAELDHRVKNMLATVLSLADETLDHSSALAEFQLAFRSRLSAMTRAHEVLARGRWTAADLGEVVRVVVGPSDRGDDHRVDARGEPIRLAARSVQALALVLNELLTNARKHGALTAPEGRVEVRWGRDPAGQLGLTWSEHDGPAVHPPRAHGLGLSLVRDLVDRELAGTCTVAFEPAGIVCAITAPLATGMQGTPERGVDPIPPTPTVFADSEARALQILLVEDDVLQARLLHRVLSRHGWMVVGPAGSVAEALHLIASRRFDAAILDVNLCGENSTRVAEVLAARDIPFLVMTGYADDDTPSGAFAGRRKLSKPVEPADVLAALAELVRRPA